MYRKLIIYETGATTPQLRAQIRLQRQHQSCQYQYQYQYKYKYRKLPVHHYHYHYYRCFGHYLLLSLISVMVIRESLTSHSTFMPFVKAAIAAKYVETTTVLSNNLLPYFDFDVPRNITVTVGQTGFLFCRVARLGDKDVSWIRKRDLHILTAGSTTYTSDQRFQVIRPENSGNWTLQIKYPQPRDSGIYECQINTEPKMSLSYTFNVIELKANIIGPTDLYVKSGSDINLTCKILQGPHELGNIFWYKGNEIIDITANQNEIDSGTRVAIENDWTDGLTSRLKVHRALSSDTGNYTCVPTIAKSASVYVHVIIGEHPAAMQHNLSVIHSSNYYTNIYCLILYTILTWCLQYLLNSNSRKGVNSNSHKTRSNRDKNRDIIINMASNMYTNKSLVSGNTTLTGNALWMSIGTNERSPALTEVAVATRIKTRKTIERSLYGMTSTTMLLRTSRPSHDMVFLPFYLFLQVFGLFPSTGVNNQKRTIPVEPFNRYQELRLLQDKATHTKR